jgi:protein transport protein SEC31
VKQGLIAAVLATLALSAPAVAQGYQPQGYPPQGYQPQGYPPQGDEAGLLRPREIMGVLRSTGFDPLDRPVRRGPNYVLRAIDGNDREVTLVIDGRNGRILSATPTRTASRMPPGVPPGAGMGEWQRMPPGYTPPPGTVPQPGYGPGAPTADDDYDDAPQQPGAYGARPPAPPVQGALPRYGNNPPRGYDAGQPDDEADAQPQSDPQVIPADPEGALPPPPERFPQRAAPPQPKPLKRAAAAPPKTAPLPKPKPNAPAAAPSTSTPPASATKEWPNSSAPDASAPKSPAPAKMPAPEETPI